LRVPQQARRALGGEAQSTVQNEVADSSDESLRAEVPSRPNQQELGDDGKAGESQWAAQRLQSQPTQVLGARSSSATPPSNRHTAIKKCREHWTDGFVGVAKNCIGSKRTRDAINTLNMFAHQFEICRANRARIGFKRIPTFESLKTCRRLKRELEFLSIEKLCENNIVTTVCEPRHGAANLLERHQEIRHHKEECAVRHAREHLINGATKLRFSFDCFSSKQANHRTPLITLTRALHLRTNFLVEDGKSNAITLM
jgi:hypothetical protein